MGEWEFTDFPISLGNIFCYYRNRELPSSSHLWDTQAFFSQESPVKARSITVFTVFLCRSGRRKFLWDSWVLSTLILLWLGRFTYITSDFRYVSFKMFVSSVFGYQAFRSILTQNSSWYEHFVKIVPIIDMFFSVLWTQESLDFGEGEGVGIPFWHSGGSFCTVRMNLLVFNMCGIDCACSEVLTARTFLGKVIGCWKRLFLWSI